MQILAVKLKNLREERREKQSDIANLLGVTRVAVSKYESGESEPSIQAIAILSKHFEVSIDYLLGESDVRGKLDYVGANLKLVLEDMPSSELVKRLYEEAGISLSEKEVSDYINSKIAPSLCTLQAIADVIGVDKAFFFKQNSKSSFEEEKVKSKHVVYMSVEQVMKDKDFRRLATVISQNKLDIAAVESIVSSAIKIKGK